MFGEYLTNAQGEDVVAGTRTPFPIQHMAEAMPDTYRQFLEIAHRLEAHYRDMQDLEFTIERGKRRESDPRPARDEPGRLSRDGGGAGRRHRARRHDQSRRRRRAWDGQVLRGRMRRTAN